MTASPRRARAAIVLAGLGVLAAAAPAIARTVVVTADGMRFTPESVTIYQGDTIEFVNVGGADNLHNVRADDGSFACSVNCTTNHTPSTLPWVAHVRFNRIATIGYYCEQHGDLGGGMRGSIAVIDRVFVDGFDGESAPAP